MSVPLPVVAAPRRRILTRSKAIGLRNVRVAAAAFSLLLALLAAAPAAATDVLASRNDDGRTGANLDETILTADSVKRDFGFLFEYDVDADVYAQPLIVSNLDIPSRGRRNVLYVADVANNVVAFDADGPAKGEDGRLWRRHFGQPETIDDALNTSSGGDGNVRKHGDVGILGTPVIDRNRHVLFVVSRQRDIVKGERRYSQWLHALDLATGADLAPAKEIVAFSEGDEKGFKWPSRIDFDPRVQNQRVGLALARDQIIIGWGSHEDQEKYYGWVMSYQFEHGELRQNSAFVTTPLGLQNGQVLTGLPYVKQDGFCLVTGACAQGGVWQTGRAPAVDAKGRVLLFIGNGRNDLAPTGINHDFGDSFVILDPFTLEVIDHFTPSNYCTLELFDLDLGGSGPMIIPESPFVVGGGKEGRIYVWSLNAPLGGYSSDDHGEAQHFFGGDRDLFPIDIPDTLKTLIHNFLQDPLRLVAIAAARTVADALQKPGADCLPLIDDVDALEDKPVFRAGHIMGGPVFWNGPAGGVMFNWSEDSFLRAYRVDPTLNAPVATPPFAQGTEKVFGHPGGILSLSANGATPGTAIVWASTYDAQHDPMGALKNLRPGKLSAFDATSDLGQTLWTSEDRKRSCAPNASGDCDSVGVFAKFNPPTVANGRVYLATFCGEGEQVCHVKVFGLLHHQYLRPGEQSRQGKAAEWFETMSPSRTGPSLPSK